MLSVLQLKPIVKMFPLIVSKTKELKSKGLSLLFLSSSPLEEMYCLITKVPCCSSLFGFDCFPLSPCVNQQKSHTHWVAIHVIQQTSQRF